MADPLALIVGAGDGLSASLARLLHGQGYRIALAARNVEKLATLAAETDATIHRCDAAVPDDVAAMFAELAGPLRVAIYNPSARVRGPITELDPQAVRSAIDVTAYGAFLVGQQAARSMLAAGEGTILFTGASAGVKALRSPQRLQWENSHSAALRSPWRASCTRRTFTLRGSMSTVGSESGPRRTAGQS